MLEQHVNTTDAEEKSERLIADLQAGVRREETFRQLFHLHYRPVLWFLVRRSSFTPQECEDLVQETFLRVYRGVDRFRHEVPFKCWLLRIATNVYRSAREKQATAKRSGLEVPLESDPEVSPQFGAPSWPGPHPLDQVLEEERLRMLQQAMEELPEQMRRCLTLRIAEELKYREIAEVMQISIQTVKAHLAQAREKLQGIITVRYREGPLEIVSQVREL